MFDNKSKLTKPSVFVFVCLLHVAIIFFVINQKTIKTHNNQSVSINLFTLPHSINSIEKSKPVHQQKTLKNLAKPLIKKKILIKPITQDTNKTIVSKNTEAESQSKNNTNNTKQLYIAPTYNKTIEIPKALFNPKPPYPGDAFDKKQEGTVVLDIKVSKKGQVQDVKIYRSSHFALLDESAIETVKIWIFDPTTMDQTKEFQWIRIPINFNIIKNKD